MGKNWLIRTKSNHILGPVSKEKVVELYQNGSIKPDDEICSGNGFWFFIRESELVEKYLLGNSQQSFNPISEAKDVLTGSDKATGHEPPHDDITLVGAIDLNKIKEAPEVEVNPSPKPATQAETQPKMEQEVPQKKKLKSDSQVKQSDNHKKTTKQNYLRYLGIFVFLVLLLMIYYRKSILKSFFESEAYLKGTSLFIAESHAQDAGSDKKKRLLESEVLIDGVSFRPLIGLEGFRVISSFDIDTFECEKLENQIYQLAVILYPTELVNEKFLLNVRNCMLKLPYTHPVKKWLQGQAEPLKPDAEEEKKMSFLTEILNSPFNLITDQKIKSQVIALIADVPENSNVEKILKAYLYLMTGNITRSDNVLKEIISLPPREFYRGYKVVPSFYHRLTLGHIEKVLQKFSRHPADRLTFYLFNVYIQSYLNKVDILELSDEVAPDKYKNKMSLNYTYKQAPELVSYSRLSSTGTRRRYRLLREEKLSLAMQSYWVWPFIDIEPLVSEKMVERIKSLDESDPLWAIYLLHNEKMSDLYFKKGGQPVSRRRSFLRKNLENRNDFMLTLFKLIEIGDVDEALVQKVSTFMNHNG